jgi:hypothetical protein
LIKTHKVDTIDHEPGISISLNLHDTRIRHKLNNLDGLLKELKLYMNDHMWFWRRRLKYKNRKRTETTMITMVVVILVTLVFPIDIKLKHSKNLSMVINA